MKFMTIVVHERGLIKVPESLARRPVQRSMPSGFCVILCGSVAISTEAPGSTSHPAQRATPLRQQLNFNTQ
jgi:hypothetical protein